MQTKRPEVLKNTDFKSFLVQNRKQQKSLSLGRGAELVEAERGFFVQLFSELYPLSVTLAGDSSPLGEPL